MVSRIFAELRRRNVFRAAAFYAASAWLLVQIATQVFPFFHIAEWVVRWIILAAVIGFPFAMIFSWLYEWTPQGFQRESEIAPDESITRRTGRRLDRCIIAVLSLAVVLLLADRFVLRKTGETSRADRVVPDKSVAVLPFVNMNGRAGDTDFSDGITEEILNALAQIPDLKVAARTSAFQFKGQNVDLRRVGEMLEVAYVLEGSVQRVNDTIRITAQLIDARSGYHLWSEKYDRALTNVFAVEDEISKAIASALQVKLAGGGEKLLVKTATANPRAHDLYLKGLAKIVERGPALQDAVAFFKQAIELDPNYGSAWAGLGQAYELFPWYKLGPWPTSLDQAEQAARKAIALDPQLAEAHTALASVLRDRFNFAEATREYETAIELNRGSSETWNQYAQMLLRMGRLEEAVQKEQAAVALDPLAPNPRYMLGMMLAGLHRFDEAIASEKVVISRSQMYSYAHFYLAYVYLYVSNFDEAEKTIRGAAVQVGEDPDLAATLVRGVADPARRTEAIKLVAEGRAGKYSMATMTDPLWLGLLGAKEEVLGSLEQWRKTTEPGALFCDTQALWAPAFDSIRNTERFQAILRSLGLPLTPVSLKENH